MTCGPFASESCVKMQISDPTPGLCISIPGSRNLNLRRLFKFSDVCGPRKSEILGKGMHKRHPASFIAILG